MLGFVCLTQICPKFSSYASPPPPPRMTFTHSSIDQCPYLYTKVRQWPVSISIKTKILSRPHPNSHRLGRGRDKNKMLRKHIMTCLMDKYLCPFKMNLFPLTGTELCSTVYVSIHVLVCIQVHTYTYVLAWRCPWWCQACWWWASSTSSPRSSGLSWRGLPHPTQTRQCTQHLLRLNSWIYNFVEVSEHKLVSFQTRVFVWFSTLILPVYRMLFINRLKFACFADFL